MSVKLYLRFLNLIHALDGGGDSPAMDLDAKRLLEEIAVRHAQDKCMTVTDAMAMSHIASPATIHRKLDQLRALGMIETMFEGKNRRTKYLRPTEMADDYFEQAGLVMKKALAHI